MIEKIDKILKALGDRSRLRIVNMLAHKSMCVCEITEVLQLSQSTVSGHLRVLKEAGLVGDQKEGLWVEYYLAAGRDTEADILQVVLRCLDADEASRRERERAAGVNRETVCRK